MLLLDTDAVSHLLRGTPRPGLLEMLAAVPPDRRFICAVTVGELLYGLERMPALGRLRERFERAFLSRAEVLPFDEAAARAYATARVDLERRRIPLDEADLQIAAVALSRGLLLVTGNVRHFERVTGLEVVGF